MLTSGTFPQNEVTQNYSPPINNMSCHRKGVEATAHLSKGINVDFFLLFWILQRELQSANLIYLQRRMQWIECTDDFPPPPCWSYNQTQFSVEQ